MKEVKRYQCDHCNKVLAKKSAMVKHETICFFNPESRSCVTCEHLDNSIESRQCILRKVKLFRLKTQCPVYTEFSRDEH